MIRWLLLVTLLWTTQGVAATHWFEAFKDRADDHELLRFLTAMPKGGDLHNHITGAVHSEWFWQLAMDAREDGYTYYTKIQINNCQRNSNEYDGARYLLLWRTIPEVTYRRLPECEQGEYRLLSELTPIQKEDWLNALRLDQEFEGRAEFFEDLWPRIGGMLTNPHLVAELVVMNMLAFGAEGVSYLEAQIPVHIGRTPADEPIAPEDVLRIYRERLEQPDAKASGVTVRFQLAILRFTPNAEDAMRLFYKFVYDHDDFVGINMVGREDNDKGYPLRFLDTLRELRRTVGDVPLAIHAGEVDEPNEHVRDTLLLGADRIGHGVNLITDPDTLLLMRHGPYLVEVNLISNLLLEYVDQYTQHPFPEYLRIDVPVALSTDDRGMWDSTLTDEFFVAVKEFDLTWEELRKLHLNSIRYSFAEPKLKAWLEQDLLNRLEKFEARATQNLNDIVATAKPQYRGFLCRQYNVCDPLSLATEVSP